MNRTSLGSRLVSSAAKIDGSFQHRARGSWRRFTPNSLAMMCAQRGSCQAPAGRTAKHVVQGPRSVPCGLDENLQLAADLLLADELVELLGTQPALERFPPASRSGGPEIRRFGFDHPLVPRRRRL